MADGTLLTIILTRGSLLSTFPVCTRAAVFHPKLSFSFHAEVDRAVDIANENQFRIKENKSVVCEVAITVVAFLLPPVPHLHFSLLCTVTTGCFS